MQDIFDTIQNWMQVNQPFATATVIKTWGSSPRPIGSTLLINQDMEMAGSVSGGCVEGAVVKAAMDILETGAPQILKFGVSDEEAWAVGLSCGGAIQVFVEPFPAFAKMEAERQIWPALQQAFNNNEACILVSQLDAGTGKHLLVYPDGRTLGSLPATWSKAALVAYNERKNQLLDTDEGQYFVQVFPRKSQLLIIGAAHITTDLVRLGNWYDFETIVIDPRGIFANKTHFPDPPHQLFVDWPVEVLPNFTLDAYTYAVLLSHDPKIDDQALHLLLHSEVAYIGALGSRRTQQKRVKRLTDAGFSEEQIARIHGPVGVDINAQRPKEIALSIMGEIIKVQHAYS
ncbi:MAG: XdhC/CoxI family protein [Saprospiraceae bacterium]|nr:MAG: XdhC/CoxI family protein [Saprospiraceae bacterium]